MTEQAVAVREPEVLPALHRPVADLDSFKRARAEWDAFIKSEMKSGLDFYRLEGYTKDALSKAGAENLMKAHGFICGEAEFIERTEDWQAPFFRYLVRVTILNRKYGNVEGVGFGECNSHEKKYRWRWVAKADVPPGLDPATLLTRDGSMREMAFAVEKAETGGKYGKPAEHWTAFREAIASGTARKIKIKAKTGKEYDAWEIGTTLYRVPNDDAASLVNTIIKMAKKRAFEDGVLTATGMSDRFTQFEEDEESGKDEPASEPLVSAPESAPKGGPEQAAGPASTPRATDAPAEVGGAQDTRSRLDPALAESAEDKRLWVARLLEQMERTGKTEGDLRTHLYNEKNPGLMLLPPAPKKYGDWPMKVLVPVVQWLSTLEAP